jgi:hypothetical protein
VGGGGVEASVVSPFTSSLASIRCTEILIRYVHSTTHTTRTTRTTRHTRHTTHTTLGLS